MVQGKGESLINEATRVINEMPAWKPGTVNNKNVRVRYNLPIKPSPNLPNEKAIAWYPSICFFEGTNVSVGRGTSMPFQVIGSPYIDSSKMKFMFIPKPTAGPSAPFLNGKKCYGYDLRMVTPKKLDLEPLIKMYKGFNDKSEILFDQWLF